MVATGGRSRRRTHRLHRVGAQLLRLPAYVQLVQVLVVPGEFLPTSKTKKW